MKEEFEEFLKVENSMEKNYREMKDMEFKIERGKMWMIKKR